MVTRPASLRRLQSAARAFRGAQRGAALVEFACIAPVMLLMYLGGISVMQGVTAARKSTVLAETLGDLVTREDDVTNSEAADDFAAATLLMAPLPSTNAVLRMRISRVYTNSQGKTCVDWSVAPTGSSFARTVGASMDTVVPTELRNVGATIIVPEVEYDYVPQFGQSITGTVTMKRAFYMRSRAGKTITLQSANPPSQCPRS